MQLEDSMLHNACRKRCTTADDDENTSLKDDENPHKTLQLLLPTHLTLLSYVYTLESAA